VASRRACEQWIAAGRISVNGVVIRGQGSSVDPESDVVEVDGTRIGLQRKRYFLLNKPRGVLCTSRDTHGRRTFLDLFRGVSERLFTVGRLDQDSEGLIVVTNNGDVALSLTHPRYETPKVYHVLLNGVLDQRMADRMVSGIKSEGEVLKAESVTLLRPGGNEYRLVLKEGRKREIRRMVAALGLDVTRLRRVAVGGLTLGTLRIGEWREMTEAERETLFRDAGMEGEGSGGGIQNPGVRIQNLGCEKRDREANPE
jgi:pseudouridine synthase